MSIFPTAIVVLALSACSEPRSPSICDGIDCSGVGTCVGQEDSFVCECPDGYISQGENCVAESHDADIDVDHDEPDAEPDAEFDAEPDAEPPCPTKFRPENTAPLGRDTKGIVFHNLSGDGFKEAIIGTVRAEAEGERDGVTIYENETYQNSRKFTTRVRILFDPGDKIGNIDLGNLDSDEDPEIISFLSRPETAESPGQLIILDDIHLGKKAPQKAYNVDYPLTSGALVKLDGDMFVDIVALSWDETKGEHLIAWRRTDDAIPDGPTTIVPLKERPEKIISFNAQTDPLDGHETLISFPEQNRLYLFSYDTENDNFSEPAHVTFFDPPLDMAVTDLDSDELKDVLVATGEGGLWHVEISMGSTFGGSTLIDDSYDIIAVTTADIDGDDDEDILASDGELMIVFCNDQGNFVFHDGIEHFPYSSFGEPTIATVNIDDNDSPDVVISYANLLSYYNE